MQSGGINIRIVVMNNVLPRSMRMHFTYDLKGSTYKRRASRKEREKSNPTFKDLDFLQDMHEGLYFDTETYNALMKTLQRDCRVRTCHHRGSLWTGVCGLVALVRNVQSRHGAISSFTVLVPIHASLMLKELVDDKGIVWSICVFYFKKKLSLLSLVKWNLFFNLFIHSCG